MAMPHEGTEKVEFSIINHKELMHGTIEGVGYFGPKLFRGNRSKGGGVYSHGAFRSIPEHELGPFWNGSQCSAWDDKNYVPRSFKAPCWLSKKKPPPPTTKSTGTLNFLLLGSLAVSHRWGHFNRVTCGLRVCAP